MSAGTLVTYDSEYGSTAAVAEIIAETLTRKGLDVDLRPVGSEALSDYAAALVGSPIRLGRCSPRTRRFIVKNRNILSGIQVAFFFTCMSVTNAESGRRLPLYVDPSFDDPLRPPARLAFMENNHTVAYYLEHFLKLIPGVTPIDIAFFKGRLHTAELSLIHRLIMRIAMFSLPEIQNGDFVNPVAIRSWAERVSMQLKISLGEE
jgi:menaquinone-dependent protoporphyrinogen IX oxidase